MKTNGSVVSEINTEVNNFTQKCENLTDTDNDMQYMIMLQISHILLEIVVLNCPFMSYFRHKSEIFV